MLHKLNLGIEYLDRHLSEEIQKDDFQRKTGIPYYHFSKVFSAVAGIGVSEYLRNRRLSESAKDLLSGDFKVIDIAFKYMYTTHESFTRAFKKFHGISPSETKQKRSSIYFYPPLSFQITVKGESKMKYRVSEKKKIKIIGRKADIIIEKGKNDIWVKEFWNNFVNKGDLDKVKPFENELGLMGVAYNIDIENMTASYIVGIFATEEMHIDGMDEVTLPETKYLIFERSGALPDNLDEFKDKIYKEFIPTSDFVLNPIAEIEVYFQGGVKSKDFYFESWISIK